MAKIRRKLLDQILEPWTLMRPQRQKTESRKAKESRECLESQGFHQRLSSPSLLQYSELRVYAGFAAFARSMGKGIGSKDSG